MNSSDLQSFKSTEYSSAGTNGGRITNQQIQTGQTNNIWPNVLKAERIAGSSLYRKVFEKVNDTNNGKLLAPKFWIDKPTEAGDWVVFFVGTASDTQADITGSERKYGCANLLNDISGNPSTFTVNVEDSSLASGTNAIFQINDVIRITNKDTPTSGTGTEQFLTISSVPTVANDTEVTITVAETIDDDYSASNTRVMTVWEPGDIECTQANHTVTTAGDGDYDFASYPLLLDNIGTVTDSLTYEFTDATHFTLTGTSGITYGSGDTSTDFEPQNPDWNRKYQTLEAAGFSGTFAAGDTITVDVTGAYVARWFLRVVPANVGSLSGNKVISVFAGEY